MKRSVPGQEGPEYFLPLSPNELQVLVALAGRPMHAHGLVQECAYQSEGIITLAKGTLYPILQRLQGYNYIRACETEHGASPHPRIIYALTAAGWTILEQETQRLQMVSSLTKSAMRAHGYAV